LEANEDSYDDNEKFEPERRPVLLSPTFYDPLQDYGIPLDGC
jgi:hypothetical protein